MTSGAIAACAIASGSTRANRKNVRAPPQMDSERAAVLNAIWRTGLPRRSENNSPLQATARVGGAGPNSSAVAIRNVSSIPTVADTDATFSRNQPPTITIAPSVSQASGSGVPIAATAECASTNAPAVTTASRYTCSAREDAAGLASRSLMPSYRGSDEVIDVPHMIVVPSVV